MLLIFVALYSSLCISRNRSKMEIHMHTWKLQWCSNSNSSSLVYRAHVLFIYHRIHRHTSTYTIGSMFQVQCCSAQWNRSMWFVPCAVCCIYMARVLFCHFYWGALEFVAIWNESLLQNFFFICHVQLCGSGNSSHCKICWEDRH